MKVQSKFLKSMMILSMLSSSMPLTGIVNADAFDEIETSPVKLDKDNLDMHGNPKKIHVDPTKPTKNQLKALENNKKFSENLLNKRIEEQRQKERIESTWSAKNDKDASPEMKEQLKHIGGAYIEKDVSAKDVERVREGMGLKDDQDLPSGITITKPTKQQKADIKKAFSKEGQEEWAKHIATKDGHEGKDSPLKQSLEVAEKANNQKETRDLNPTWNQTMWNWHGQRSRNYPNLAHALLYDRGETGDGNGHTIIKAANSTGYTTVFHFDEYNGFTAQAWPLKFADTYGYLVRYAINVYGSMDENVDAPTGKYYEISNDIYVGEGGQGRWSLEKQRLIGDICPPFDESNPTIVDPGHRDRRTLYITFEDSDSGKQLGSDEDELAQGARWNATNYKRSFEGYDFDYANPKSGTMGSNDVYTTLYYAKKQGAPITVKYVDEDGNELSEKTLTGKWGNSWSAEDLKIDNYERTGSLPSGKFNGSAKTVEVKYKALAKQVKIHYVDQNGNKIHDDDSIKGNFKTSFDANDKKINITGYDFDSVSQGSLTGEYSKDTSDITLKYQAKQGGDVAIKYQDDKGQDIKETNSEKISGLFNEDYDASTATYKKNLESVGWNLDESKLPSNAKGKFTLDPQEVIYHYTMRNKTVKIHFVDQKGNTIGKDQEITGQVSKDYDAKSFEDVKYLDKDNQVGYTFSKVSKGVDKGKYADDTSDITMEFQAKQAGKIRVKYVDQFGEQAQDDKTVDGLFNDDYDVSGAEYSTPTDTEGYELDKTKLPDNSKGKFKMDEQVVTYHFIAHKRTIKVTYENQHGKKLHDDDSFTGQISKDFDLNKFKIDIPHYSFAKLLSGEFTGKMTSKTADLKLQYQGDPVPKTSSYVTIKHIDENGKEIKEMPDVVLGKDKFIGDSYDTTSYRESTSKHYKFKEVQTGSADEKGEYDENPKTITYVYQTQEADGGVKIDYVNGNKTVLKTETKNGLWHYSDETTAPEFKGYKIKSITGDTDKIDGNKFSYTFDDKDKHIVVEYEAVLEKPKDGEDKDVTEIPTGNNVSEDNQMAIDVTPSLNFKPLKLNYNKPTVTSPLINPDVTYAQATRRHAGTKPYTLTVTQDTPFTNSKNQTINATIDFGILETKSMDDANDKFENVDNAKLTGPGSSVALTKITPNSTGFNTDIVKMPKAKLIAKTKGANRTAYQTHLTWNMTEAE